MSIFDFSAKIIHLYVSYKFTGVNKYIYLDFIHVYLSLSQIFIPFPAPDAKSRLYVNYSNGKFT